MRSKFSLEKQEKFDKKNTKHFEDCIFAVLQVPLQLGMHPRGCKDAFQLVACTLQPTEMHLKDSRLPCAMETEALKLAAGLQEWWVASMCPQQASTWSLPPVAPSVSQVGVLWPGLSSQVASCAGAGPAPRASPGTIPAPKELVQLGWGHLHTSSCIPLFFCCDGAAQGFLPHHTVPLPGFVSSNKSGEAQAFQSPLTSLLMTYIISSSTCFSFFPSFVI